MFTSNLENSFKRSESPPNLVTSLGGYKISLTRFIR
jgi:hypothetical protein